MRSSRQTERTLSASGAEKRRAVLLTNDDGIQCEGLTVLEQALRAVADVYVLAPDGNRSAVSNHITMHRPLCLSACGAGRFASEGNPVDCVIAALRSDLFGVRFDAVVSGINRGANLGTDIVYSGTAAAARQAVLYGMPGIAVSLESYDGSWQFAPLADFVAKNLGALVSLCTKDSFVSVNAASRSSYAGVAVTTLSRRNYLDRVEILDAPDGKRYGFFAGGEIVTGGAAGNDYEAVRDGKISVSLVRAEPETERTDAAVCFVL